MSGEDEVGKQKSSFGKRDFLYTLFGGIAAAVAGWLAGAFPQNEISEQEELIIKSAESRISALESKIEELKKALEKVKAEQQAAPPTATPTPKDNASELEESSILATESRISTLESKVEELSTALEQNGIDKSFAELEGMYQERITFHKKELSVINPDGVLLNLVATNGGVGIRFYKDFGFGNEQVTNPWHMGWIEGLKGYQGLAILRDWRFTAALWDEDGKLLLGSLDPHPPANEPAEARLHVRGRVNEVQAMIEASPDQTDDIFKITSERSATTHLAVNSSGNLIIGSSSQPQKIILYDTYDHHPYSLTVANGKLALARV